MKFKYLGFKADKSLAKGELQAGSEREAKALLQSKGIELVNLEKKRNSILKAQINIGGVSDNDRLFFVKHLAVMLKAGIPIADALTMLKKQAKGSLQSILKKVIKDIEDGSKLSDALAKYPKTFPEVFVQLVGSGELAGTLEANLNYIATYSKKEIEMKKKVRSAMLYPSIVFIAVLGLGMSIGLFVLPQILPLFQSLDVALPTSTRILLWFAEFFEANGLKIVGLILALAFVLPIVLELKPIRPLSHRIYLRAPIAGPILKQINLGRFFRIFGTLMEAGIPIDKALTTTREIIRNQAFKTHIGHMLRAVNQGEMLSDSAAENEFLFPAVTQHMLRVGERSGNLEESSEYLANFYEEEVDDKLKNLSTLLEPVLLIFIGLLVGGVAFSIIGPIYSLSGSIR